MKTTRLNCVKLRQQARLLMTKEDVAISNKMMSLDAVDLCSYKEADTRIFVHAQDATQDGCKCLIIKADDTDAILQQLGLQSMWIDFGQGAKARWIPVHELLSALGPEKASGILYFHASTGCEVSAVHRKGKKSAWLTWDVCEEVSETFTRLSHCSTEVSDADFQMLETFVVLMYDRSSASSGVDEGRLDLFACKQIAYDAIPTTRAALKEHAKSVVYQAGILWGQAIVSNPEISSPANWGMNTDRRDVAYILSHI